MTGSGFTIRPEDLHAGGRDLQQFGEQVTSGGRELQDLGLRLVSHVSNDRSGVGAVLTRAFGRGMEISGKVFDQGGRVTSAAGERLRVGADNHTNTESSVTRTFQGIHPHATERTRGESAGTSKRGGPGPSRTSKPNKGDGGRKPYSRPPGKGSGQPHGGGNGNGGNGNSNGGGGGTGGDASTPQPGQPGRRPDNFDPNIPTGTHSHVTHGGFNSNGPRGGHVLQNDLNGHPHPDPVGYTNGHYGHGVEPHGPGQSQPKKHQTNGVYQLPNPQIGFHDRYGAVEAKYSAKHTMFPPGIDGPGVQRIGHDAWNDPNGEFWPEDDGKPSGHWIGHATIPDGHPNAGMSIKINGRYDSDGRATTYFPSPNQPEPSA